MKENIQHLRKILRNYSLATGFCDKNHSVQIASMMSIIGDESSRIIYRLVLRYERYLFNSFKQETEETYLHAAHDSGKAFVHKRPKAARKVVAVKDVTLVDTVQTCKSSEETKQQLDKGASCNIVSLKTLQKIVVKSLNLSDLRIVLRAFGGFQRRVQGTYTLSIRTQRNKVHNLVFEVVEYDHCPFLSAEASSS
ncbi:hypothetical protein J6590_036219 [Homalodisca vitripennis]|nr:hypothetical protein J6590_036219 [Homalodisca vitripennis]